MVPEACPKLRLTISKNIQKILPRTIPMCNTETRFKKTAYPHTHTRARARARTHAPKLKDKFN